MQVEWNFSAVMQMESVSLNLDTDTDVHLVEWKNVWSPACHKKVDQNIQCSLFPHEFSESDKSLKHELGSI